MLALDLTLIIHKKLILLCKQYFLFLLLSGQEAGEPAILCTKKRPLSRYSRKIVSKIYDLSQVYQTNKPTTPADKRETKIPDNSI